jgi:hypothetical protein
LPSRCLLMRHSQQFSNLDSNAFEQV